MTGFLCVIDRDDRAVDRELFSRMAHGLAVRRPGPIRKARAAAAAFAAAPLRADSEAAEGPALVGPRDRHWLLADARIDGRDALLSRFSDAEARTLRPLGDAGFLLRLAVRPPGLAGGLLEGLVGDFAFLIWQEPRRQLQVARDPVGTRPLFYAEVGAHLVVSNTLRCILLHPELDLALDEEAIADFLITSENPRLDATFRRRVKRLAPGHTLTSHGRRSIRIERFAPDPEPVPTESRPALRPADQVDGFAEQLRRAVSDRMRGPRAGILMSGGIDSTSVAAMARDVLRGRGERGALRGFTFVYEDLIAHDEAHFASLAASHLEIPLHSLAVDRYELYDARQRAHSGSPQPGSPQPVIGPLGAGEDLYGAAARHSGLLLTGYGGDPLLGREPFYLARLVRSGQLLRALRESVHHALVHGRPPPTGARTFWRQHLWRQRCGARDEMSGYPDWIAPELEARWGLRERWRSWQQGRWWGSSSRLGSHERASTMAALRAPTWTNHFESLDPGMTELPVRVSHPFFDVRLLPSVLALPALPWCSDKAILRAAMRGRLPEAVRRRPKTPLGAFPNHGFPGRTRQALAATLRRTPGLDSFVQVEHVAELVANGHRIGAPALHALFPVIGLADWLGSGPWGVTRPASRPPRIPRRESHVAP